MHTRNSAVTAGRTHQLWKPAAAVIMLIFALVSCTTASDSLDAGSATDNGSTAFIPQDSRLLSGELENGMEYYIRENDRPENKAELRLVVNAGSILEDEDQLGLAHYLEHMAFNGTEKYPKNEIVSFLQEIGMEFGPDINAYTSFDETVYMLSVPLGDEQLLDTGFEVLREWAFHMSIRQEDVDEERGVILEEWRLGRGANQRILEQILPVLFQDSRYARRLPIGSEEIIRTADAAVLRRFYEDWYRPDLMAVIAVGDFQADEIEAKIRTTFSGYGGEDDTAGDDEPTGEDEPRERPRYDVPLSDEDKYMFVTDPEATVTSIEVMNQYEPSILRRPDQLDDVLAEQLFYSMINSRFSEIVQTSGTPFITAQAYSTQYTRWSGHSGITVLSSPDGIPRAVKNLGLESERLRRHGFLPSELERAKQNLLRSYENYYRERDNREHSSLMGEIQEHFLKDSPVLSPSWLWKQVQQRLPEIDTGDFSEIISRRLDPGNRLLLISGPDSIEQFRLEKEEAYTLLDSWNSAEVEPWDDGETGTELVEEIPGKGNITARETDSETGIHRWELSNGAVVYVKPTDFKSDEILFSAFSPGGLNMAEDDEYLSASLASTISQVSGLGGYSAVELNKFLSGINASVSPYVGDIQEGLQGSASPEDLEILLQMAYLNFTDPRADLDAWNTYAGRLSSYLEEQERDPRFRYQNRISQVVYDSHPRAENLSAEDVSRVDFTTAERFFAERFSNPGDFTFVFVGNADLEELENGVEQWIASIPSGEERDPVLDRGMDYFDEDIRSELKAGIEPLSIVTQVWTGSTAWNYENYYHMASLSSALDIILVEKVREAAGGTYSISSSFAMSRQPTEDYRFVVQFSCEPSRTDELIAIVNDEIQAIIDGTLESEYAGKVQESQRVNYSDNLQRNGWWLNQIQFLLEHELDWELALNKEEWYDRLTADNIISGAERWLGDQANYAEIILLPQEEQ
ncbi:M16 family metallopeptidase [Salinispira pacifica]|uniref:Putative zinc protease pqqL n=1 Tax=Salinispira pacifica TaxID=1307761 RepID=V5WI37_9SPIO|nr:M16 family metallopeptidase [Salinispira pacifica]AHC15492.1 putative zinc protease pqqL [Salinispira pacifica]